MNKFVVLPDRAVLTVKGPDALEFLQGLITNDMAKIADQGALLAALLTPQGKIQHEFFIAPIDGGYVVETAKDGLADLYKKLSLYKMRANVELEDVSSSQRVVWFETAVDQLGGVLAQFIDPRHKNMGLRVVCADVDALASTFQEGALEDYLAQRVRHGVPEGGLDYGFGDSFPHEACYDFLDGVDFEKGCYVGQEVVSRMQHRSTTRKRIVLVEGDRDLPDPGAEIRTDTSLLGVLGTVVGCSGLALMRLDRAGKALGNGDDIKADGVTLTLSLPGWASYRLEEPLSEKPLSEEPG